MKKLDSLVVALLIILSFGAAGQGTVVYQNDFSTRGPNYEQTTTGGYINWSVTGSREEVSGNQFARFDFNIASSPTNSNTRWYGGFWDQVSSAGSLPSQWQLSFDVSLNSLEPVMVRLLFVPSTFPPATTGTAHTYWLQPAALGWQTLTMDQNTAFTTSTVRTGDPGGVDLQVFLSSRGPTGDPLSISQIGTYNFLLDNVVLQSVPEPDAVGLFSAALLVFVVRRHRTRLLQATAR